MLLAVACMLAGLAAPVPRLELASDRLRVGEPYVCDAPGASPRARLELLGPTTRLEIGGYLDRPYTSRLERSDAGRMVAVLRPAGEAVMRFRITPLEAGDHTLRLRDGAVASEANEVFVRTLRSPGLLRLPSDGYPTNDGFLPRPRLGCNLAWTPAEGAFALDGLLRKLSGAGVDVVRVYLDSPTRSFDLLGADGIDLGHAWRLEQCLEQARGQGVGVVLVLSARAWRASEDFYTSAAERARFREMARYAVARYGGYPNLAAWEICADVAAGEPGLLAWCTEAVETLQQADPWRHPIGAGAAAGDAEAVELLRTMPGLSYVGLAVPASPDPAAAVAAAVSGVPNAWVTSYGADAPPPTDAGVAATTLHDILLAGIFSTRMGTAMPWWWDSWIRRANVADRYAAANALVAAVRWQGLRPVPAEAPPGWGIMALANAESWLAWLRPVEPAAPQPVRLATGIAPAAELEAGVFDPWTSVWTRVPPRRDGQRIAVSLPRAERDVVVLVRRREPAPVGAVLP